MTEFSEAHEAALIVDGVTVEFGEHRALSNVTFTVEQSTLMGVVGPNGAGKSTLFNGIAGLQMLNEGTVTVCSARTGGHKGALAYVPQRESVNWRFPVSVMDVVLMGRTVNHSWFQRPGRQDRELARDCLERVGLWAQRSNLMTELSGGQRQRVFVARALAQGADVLLLDEAFSGVDVGAQEGLVKVLHSLRDEGRIIVLATHDLTNLAERFDMILCLNHHVCAFGPPDEAFTPEVLEELYGAHGVHFAQTGEQFEEPDA